MHRTQSSHPRTGHPRLATRATETLERHVRFRMNSSHIWSRRRESIADRVCFWSIGTRMMLRSSVDASIRVRALNWQHLRWLSNNLICAPRPHPDDPTTAKKNSPLASSRSIGSAACTAVSVEALNALQQQHREHLRHKPGASSISHIALNLCMRRSRRIFEDNNSPIERKTLPRCPGSRE